MESVGQKIREARLRLGLTLEQISAKTRITVKNLQAIEMDEPLQIGSAFLYKSFVRQFIDQLGLEYRHLAPEVQSAASAIPKPLIPGQGHVVPKVPPLRAKRSKKRPWINSVASLVLMWVACSAVYSTWQTSRSKLHSSIGAWMDSVKNRSSEAQWATQELSLVGSKPIPAANLSTGAASVSTNNTAGVSNTAFRIELSALERTWLSIVADGQETFTGMLEASETKGFEGRDSARIHTRNAGAVNVVFNGKLLGTLGERGQIRTVVFTRQGYEVLRIRAPLALASFNPIGE